MYSKLIWWNIFQVNFSIFYSAHPVFGTKCKCIMNKLHFRNTLKVFVIAHLFCTQSIHNNQYFSKKVLRVPTYLLTTISLIHPNQTPILITVAELQYKVFNGIRRRVIDGRHPSVYGIWYVVVCWRVVWRNIPIHQKQPLDIVKHDLVNVLALVPPYCFIGTLG